MIERKQIERDGPGRRRFPQDDNYKCPWCDDKEEASRERWNNLHAENIERQRACSSVITELRNDIKNMAEQKADKFTVQLAITILLAAWILISGVNTYLIQSIKSELKVHTEVSASKDDR